MLYGRSLYGGAQYPRQVTAEGSLTCAASCDAASSVGYRLGGGTAAFGAVATAAGVRVVIPSGVTRGVAAVAPSPAVAEFRPGALAACPGTVRGTAKVDFFTLGEAATAAACSAKLLRFIRVNRAATARGAASCIVDGDVFALADSDPVVCRARVFGTHWFVGNVAPQPGAQVTGEAQRIRPTAGAAQAAAAGAFVPRVDANAAGMGCEVSAGVDLDPLHTAGGVRYWDARGQAVASVELAVEPYTYSVALAVGRATLRLVSNARRAGAGRIVGVARPAPITSEIVMPQQGQIVVGADAQGQVSSCLEAFGQAQVGATGAVAAQARFDAVGRIAVPAIATASSGPVELWVSGNSTAAARASGFITRDILAGGVSRGAGRASGDGLAQRAAGAAVTGLMQGTGAGGLHLKINTSGAATCAVVLIGAYRMAHRMAGSASALASTSAVNLVNDARQPLSSRLVVVNASLHSLEVVPSARTLEVPSDARRMAA